MINQLERSAPPIPSHGSLSRSSASAGPPPAATADREREADRRPLLAELDRLRGRVDRQAHTLTVLTQAVSVLRSGNRALREENRELRLQLQKKGRSLASVGEPEPRQDPTRPALSRPLEDRTRGRKKEPR